MILFEQVKHGDKFTYTVPPIHFDLPASMTAFYSACIQRHSSRPTPEGVIELHLWQPPSEQFSIPNGVPLYPVDTILMSFTITHPTNLFMQFDLEATISHILRK